MYHINTSFTAYYVAEIAIFADNGKFHVLFFFGQHHLQKNVYLCMSRK
jgi:hypothetical protein